jgi:hypothetical protein
LQLSFIVMRALNARIDPLWHPDGVGALQRVGQRTACAGDVR